MTYLLEIEIPGLPKTTNSGGRMHWSRKVREAKHWKAAVWTHTIGRRPVVPLKRAAITFIRHSSVEPDFDGLVSSFKHTLDALTDAHIIENDKPSIVGTPTYRWVKAAPKHGKITIIVEEIE